MASHQESLAVLFDLARRLFTDDDATAQAEQALAPLIDAVTATDRATIAIARPLLAWGTLVAMFGTSAALFFAAGRLDAIVLVLPAVVAPFGLAWPARALRRSLKGALLRLVVARAEARLTIETRAIFASPVARGNDTRSVGSEGEAPRAHEQEHEQPHESTR